jgi:hypothetical protein
VLSPDGSRLYVTGFSDEGFETRAVATLAYDVGS